MSVVTYFVETSQGYLNTAAETQFGSVAATVGTLLVLGTTVVVIFVFLNMIYQYKAMDGRTAFWLAVKIGLIGIFATNWVQFNALSSAILAGIDSIAGALVASVGGGLPGPSGTFAEEYVVDPRWIGRFYIGCVPPDDRPADWNCASDDLPDAV